MEEIQLTIPREVSYLRFATTLSKLVCQQIKECGADKKFASDVELCVSEACTNAIKYARSIEKEDVISLYFQIYGDKLVIKVQDRGSGFNLNNLPDPDIERVPERGYGLYIIRSKMDEVKYFRTEKGNFLTMIKFFKGEKN
ncbi:MAG: ATP-binding protein [Candidatus Aminicenantes bacterium]|jgi:serine/threonine-protein kinase RsbW